VQFSLAFFFFLISFFIINFFALDGLVSSPAERIYRFFFYPPFFLRSYRRASSRLRLLLLRPYTPFRRVRGVFPEVIYSALHAPLPWPNTHPHRQLFVRSDAPIPGQLHRWRCSTVCSVWRGGEREGRTLLNIPVR